MRVEPSALGTLQEGLMRRSIFPFLFYPLYPTPMLFLEAYRK